MCRHKIRFRTDPYCQNRPIRMSGPDLNSIEADHARKPKAIDLFADELRARNEALQANDNLKAKLKAVVLRTAKTIVKLENCFCKIVLLMEQGRS